MGTRRTGDRAMGRGRHGAGGSNHGLAAIPSRHRAVEFNKTAPLLWQNHHMFWSLPLLLIVPFVWRKPRLSGAMLGVSLGLIVSDLMHHFVVLPLIVGNTGWHWP